MKADDSDSNVRDAGAEAFKDDGTASDQSTVGSGTTAARFTSTHWSLVLPAAQEQMPGAQEALEALCRIYWPPLYAFLRKHGHNPEDAQDLTQGFFAFLLGKGGLQGVHPSKGKFRSFLLACLNNYVRNQWKRGQARKRGGGHVTIPINLSDAEEHTSIDPPDMEGEPDKAFDRRWAEVLVAHVRHQLEENYRSKAKFPLLEVLYPYLTGDAERGDYTAIAAKLQMNEGAVRTAVSRLRSDFRDLLRAEVGRTVNEEREIDEEIRYLLSVLRPI